MKRAFWLVGGLALVVAACGGTGPGGGIDGGGGDGGPGPDASCPDDDGDGVTTCAGDCDDADPLNVPGGNEICGDAADNDCDQMADEACSGGIGTFVSAATGNDANPGTQAMPVASIGQGVMNALTLGSPQTVIVAQGRYMEKVTLFEGIDLLGGYQCDTSACTWARDPAVNVSSIANTDYEGVVAGAGVTQATLVEGFTINGRDGVPPAQPGSAAITLAGGSPTIRGNVIAGGNVTGGGFAADRAAGIILLSTTDPAGALIEGNDISGGTSVSSAVAVMFDWTGSGMALATVTGNTLRGGTGQHSVGLVAWNSLPGTLVTNNDILAGSSDGGASHGIELGSAMTIDDNRINADQLNVGTCTNTRQWCSGIFSESSTATITNNVIYGAKGERSCAVHLGEFEVPAGAIVLNGNVLAGGGVGPLAGAPTDSAALVVRIGTCMTCGFNGFVGRARNNILDGGNNLNRFGVLEDPAPGRVMRPEVLENNLFTFAAASGRADVMFREIDAAGTATDHTDVNTINVLTTPLAAANLSGDPLLDAAWHLMSGSPCIDQGTATEAAATDFDGDPRPTAGTAVDIGADETP